MKLNHLTDKTLLLDTKDLAVKERQISLKILHHLREIERRRLFSDLGYGSLFEYSVKELGYSESSASRRIQSSRVLKDFPEIEKKIEQGKLTMTNVAMAAFTFKNENITDKETRKEILTKIENSTKKGCEKTLLLFSKEEPLPKEKEKALTTTVYGVNFNLSVGTMDKLRELRDLLAHKRLNQDQILSFAFGAAIDKIQNDKFKINAKLSSPVAKPCTKRYITAIVKKEVYLRDKGQCTKCKTSFKLEYDHITPFAQGGKSNLSNLRLLCFSCNQRRLKT
jgi:phage terminase small subunit